MNKPQITIKDIARALNVSPSTVSRALKDNPDISQETRNLIHAYAREHNYKPNVLAVNLRASRSNTIGVIVPQLVHHFFSCVLSGIEKAAAEAGYNILVAQSNESYEQEVKIVHSFLAARVCGVIASLAKDTSQYDHYQDLLNNNIPIVFYDRICTGLKTERVVVDDCRFFCCCRVYDTDRLQAYPVLWSSPAFGNHQEPPEWLSGCHEEIQDSRRRQHDYVV